MTPIIFESLGTTRIPQRSTELSAGYDCFAYLPPDSHVKVYGQALPGLMHEVTTRKVSAEGILEINPQERVLIPLGFKAQMPRGYEAQVRPRSGLALKQGLTVINSPGTIDADYGEEWGVVLVNHSQAPVTVTHEQRVAQLVFNKHETPEFVEGTVTNMRGGFGSTGA